MTTQLRLTSTEGITIDSIDLSPGVQLRLQAFAKANHVSMIDMINLAIRFTIAPERDPVALSAPEEEEIWRD